MFQYINLVSYDEDNECNVFDVHDHCIGSATITSPHATPSLVDKPKHQIISNAITVLSIIDFYEHRDRNVAFNLAAYFCWLHTHMGFR